MHACVLSFVAVKEINLGQSPLHQFTRHKSVRNKLAPAKVHCVCCVVSFPEFHYNDLLTTCWRCRLQVINKITFSIHVYSSASCAWASGCQWRLCAVVCIVLRRRELLTELHLRATECHLQHSVLTPARQAGTRFTYPVGTKGWVVIPVGCDTPLDCERELISRELIFRATLGASAHIWLVITPFNRSSFWYSIK